MMKLLLITAYIPYPLSEGGKISQFAIIDYLKDHDDLTLALVANSKADLENIAHLKTLLPGVKIEVVDLTPVRDPLLLRSFRRAKHQLRVFLNKYKAAKRAPVSCNEFDNAYLNNIPHVKERGLINGLAELISKENYDLVQIDIIDFIDLVYLLPADVKKVFVHHEIRFARLASAARAEGRTPFGNYIFRFVQDRELHYLRQYDAVIVFSEQDQARLNVFHGLEGKVHVSPFPVLDKYLVDKGSDHAPVNKLVFIGGEGHYPNKQAVQWYADEIGPLIEASLNIKMHVIGNWSRQTIEYLTKSKNIHFAGYVDDIISYCKNSIMLVPIRMGSGIRTKILYAMAQGVPVISTAIGCEGIRAVDNKSIMIADTPQEFLSRVTLLLNDAAKRSQLAAGGQAVVRDFYSQEVAGALRRKLFLTLLAEDEQ